jgi:small subunit ribosomal protein S15
MRIDAQTKKEILNTYGVNDRDTGKTEVQIALFSHRILHLTDHLKGQKNDKGTQRALIALVGKRRALLDYLKAKDITRYRQILQQLNLRK